jgi:hypothetical protein
METLIISIIALVMSTAALAWSAWSWVHSGPVVRVDPHIPLPNDEFPPGDLPVEVRATNRGRGPVTIEDWGYKANNGREARMIEGIPPSVKVPFRLEPGDEASWYLPRHQAINLCHDLLESAHQKVRAFVVLGSGKVRYARHRGIGLK